MARENPGKLLSREEFQSKLWPRTIVDFDHGLNKAINKIREALGDSAENPRFVETVPRRGYRFLADVEVINSPGRQPEATPDDAGHAEASGVGHLPAAWQQRPISFLWRVFGFGFVLLLVAILLWLLYQPKYSSP